MAFAPHSSTWDIDPILDLLRALSTEAEVDSPPQVRPRRAEVNPSAPVRLGNFDAVLELMGKPIDIPAPRDNHNTRESANDSSAASSLAGSYSTAASSPPALEVLDYDTVVKNRVRFSEDTKDRHDTTRVTAKFRRRRSLDKSWDTEEFTRLINSKAPLRGEVAASTPTRRSKRLREVSNGITSDFDSDVDTSSLAKSVVKLPSASLLTPAWVTPPPVRPVEYNEEPWVVPADNPYNEGPWVIPPDIPHIHVSKQILKPLLTLTKEERKAVLVRRLMKDFTFGPASNITKGNAAQLATQNGGNMAEDGIHVFIDASNIVIGFYDAVKTARGLSKNAYTSRPPIDFHSLSLILERGRSAAKRALCGSLDSSDNEPDYMAKARQCDYSVSAMKRVEKVRPFVVKRRGGNGYATSGPSSGSDAFTKPLPNVGEQAVDELLQLHMCTSLLETERPSTMVLATGDAAEAEYSGGFQKYVELALAKGWKIELVCWQTGMSSAWIRRDFLQRWKKQFTIIHLDDYREELFADYVQREPEIRFADGNMTD